jgi:hypothetical protein
MIKKAMQADDEIKFRILFQMPDLNLDFFRIEQIVTIEELDKASASVLKAGIACDSHALIGLRD